MNLNPVQVTQRLQNALVDYLTTTFDVNRDGQNPILAAEIRTELEGTSRLFNGPFLEITPPYHIGQSVNQLIDEGVLSPKLQGIHYFKKRVGLPLHAPLYLHQETAIRRITQDERGVVVSSGTGSGKTESFLIPIINDLLVDTTPGVRAILVYPLNALVNDQLDRLREWLKDTNITFGRYTSELPNTTKEAEENLRGQPRLPNEIISREQIRKENKIPQILITNYAMLEYLLLRPQDSALFNSGAWRFIILDEAHTYNGAKGIEVAMLIRRLKLRLNKQPGDVRCIATSATLVRDDPEQAVTFAQNLFGEPFTTDDIIFGQTDKEALLNKHDVRASDKNGQHSYAQLDPRALLDEAQTVDDIAEYLHQHGLLDDDEYLAVDSSKCTDELLYQALSRDPYLNKLREWMLVESNASRPVSVQEAADYLFTDLNEPTERHNALYHLIELGASARPTPESASLLPARYHVFARAPQGLWACLNPACTGRKHQDPSIAWSKLYSTPHVTCDECGAYTYPLAICRTCGQVYIYGQDHEGELRPDVLETQPDNKRYYTWSPVMTDSSQADPDDDTADTDEGLDKNEKKLPKKALTQEKVELCVMCGRTSRCKCENPKRITLHQVKEATADERGRTQSNHLSQLSQCVRCNDRARVKDSEIATAATVGGSAPISVITTELYRNLPPSSKEGQKSKPGAGRKLLTFYDSRQGAARFAAYLQDVFNQRMYLYLIPRTIQHFEHEEGYPPNFTNLSERFLEKGWELRIFQNDLELIKNAKINRITGRLDRNQRKELLTAISTRLLAEITVNRRSRQALEALGLMTVDYFESVPDLNALAQQISLSPEQTYLLIRQLLDTLRLEKVVMFPSGVQADSGFGRHQGHPSVVRGSAGGSEVPWLGSTERHRRFRLIERALKHVGQPATPDDIQRVADALWDWLTQPENGVLTSIDSGKYRIHYNSLYFSAPSSGWGRCDKCQRVYHNAESLPCAHPTCGGVVRSTDDISSIQDHNYYYKILHNELIPMRIEEHTAQLSPERGRDYQNQFKEGGINVLSCSTTFEMGIDLGDLQAVLLSNVPPTVANYRQRSGRAGRRTSGAAFIITWAQDRPHDQLYFKTPEQIISGDIRVPSINLDNKEIRARHANAILLSAFVRDLHRQDSKADFDQMGTFFDANIANGSPHIAGLDAWCTADKTELVRRFYATLNHRANGQDDSITAFKCALEAERERYQTTRDYYSQREQEMSNRSLYDDAKTYKKLRERLAQEYLIDMLSNHGVLPSYSFPLYTVELELPYDKEQEKKQLRLQRDLRHAIREYAPGAEIVADKRLWRSNGVKFYRDTRQEYHYKLCGNCNRVTAALDAGIEVGDIHCPACGNRFDNNSSHVYIEPDGFTTNPKSGNPAGQYVERPISNMRSALLTQTETELIEQGQPSLIKYGYARDGRLFYVNEGRGKGFRICMDCGHEVGREDKNCKNKIYGKVCGSTNLQSMCLGHAVTTDTLHLQLQSSANVTINQRDTKFWYTLLYALLQGASRALQIERQDIDGLLHPINTGDNNWSYSIVLYDTVPGGAGHVAEISQRLREVVREAYQIVSTCDCAPNTSCVHCLRDYYNQTVYEYLERGSAQPYLQALLSSLESGDGIVAINHSRWLMNKIAETRRHLVIAAETLTDKTLSYTNDDSWMDILYTLLRRGVEISLLLKDIPNASHDSHHYLLGRLKSLMQVGAGLKLFRLRDMPDWQIVIDAHSADGKQQAIRLAERTPLSLDGDISGYLQASQQEDIVSQALHVIESVQGKAIAANDLNLPPQVTVHDIPSGYVGNESKIAAISALFSKPVQSLFINDPYLLDESTLVDRVAQYITLAQQGGALQNVHIRTSDAKDKNANHDAQNRAITKLEKHFIGQAFTLKVDRKATKEQDHDRYIEIRRPDGTRARMIIGRGLDFIRADGRALKTYLIVEDPWR